MPENTTEYGFRGTLQNPGYQAGAGQKAPVFKGCGTMLLESECG